MTTAVILSKQAATRLTERIRKAGEDFGRLLLEAHEGEAWRAMGYATWGDYVAGEFTFTRSQSYRLLATASVERHTGERVSGQLAEKVVASMRQVTEITSESEQSEAMKAALAEQRSGPAPKPTGRHRGFQPPTEQVRHWCETAEGWAEQIADDPLDPDFARALRRLNDVVVGMLRGDAM